MGEGWGEQKPKFQKACLAVFHGSLTSFSTYSLGHTDRRHTFRSPRVFFFCNIFDWLYLWGFAVRPKSIAAPPTKSPRRRKKDASEPMSFLLHKDDKSRHLVVTPGTVPMPKRMVPWKVPGIDIETVFNQFATPTWASPPSHPPCPVTVPSVMFS